MRIFVSLTVRGSISSSLAARLLPGARLCFMQARKLSRERAGVSLYVGALNIRYLLLLCARILYSIWLPSEITLPSECRRDGIQRLFFTWIFSRRFPLTEFIVDWAIHGGAAIVGCEFFVFQFGP